MAQSEWTPSDWTSSEWTRSDWKWKDVELPETSAQELGLHFQTDLYEAALKSDPSNVEWLVSLADLFSRQGCLEKGLEIDMRLVQIRPKEPSYYYNLACTHSLMGQLDRAFQALSHAVQLGYNKIDHLRADPDLENLKKDSRYQEIINKILSKKIGK